MATLAELRKLARDRKIPNRSKLKTKSQLMAALGMSEDKKPSAKSSKKSESGKKFQTGKVSTAIARAIAKKHGGNAEEIHADLKKKVKSAIDKKRREMKKQGKEPTPKDLRAAAILAVKATVKTQTQKPAKTVTKLQSPQPEKPKSKKQKAEPTKLPAKPSVHPDFTVSDQISPDSFNQAAMISVSSKDGKNRASIGILSAHHSGASHSGNSGRTGKATDPHQLENIGLDMDRSVRQQILGLTHNANQIVGVTEFHNRAKGRFTEQQKTDAFTSAIATHVKEGSIVAVPAHHFGMIEDAKKIAKHPVSQHMTHLEGRNGGALVGIVRDGKLTPLTESDRKRMEQGAEVRRLRQKQFEDGVQAYQDSQESIESTKRNIARSPDGKSKDFLQGELKRQQQKNATAFDREDQAAAEAGKLEDEYLGRKPKAGKVESEAHYRKKAEEWAKSQGFGGDGVNGFSAEATKAHDIAHPITHEMVGMDSKAIHKHFGSILQKNGKPSLLAEEAIVNVAEHLSRGDSLEAAIISGLRVARVLSRNKEHETDQGRSGVRSDDFRLKLTELAEKLHRNDNFNDYMKHIRKANRVSGTVKMAGNDFSRTASGG